jgi:glucose-6-phosphate-specific signal transduction histidine kinase
VGHKSNTEVTKSLEICSRIHNATHELLKRSKLPKLDELGKNIVTKELVEKVHDNTNQRREVVEATTTITIDLIDQHLLQPVKLHTMIQDFMTMIVKYMSTLQDSMAMNNASLEHLVYRRIISLFDRLEIWKAYIRDKTCE